MRSEGYGSCCVCPSVSLSVCLLADISVHEPWITPQTIPERQIKVEKYVRVTLKLLRLRVTA